MNQFPLTLPLSIVLALCSAIVGVAAATIIAKYGNKLGLVDIPNERSAHFTPTPKGGGIGIPIAAGAAVFVSGGPLVLMAALTLVLAVFSLIDDYKDLPVSFRFLVQFALALVMTWFYKKEVIQLMQNQIGLAAVAGFVFIIAIYITATTNFFNFMDGINGISGFMSIISFGWLGVYAFFFKSNTYLTVLAVAVVFSSFGFLTKNFPRARVFMGDVGSIFIGNLFAAVVVWQSGDFPEFLLLLSFQATLYIDCVSTILMRLAKRENVLQAHKKHLYQRFIHQLEWSHPRVTLLFAAIQFIFGGLALLLYHTFSNHQVIALILLWLLTVSVYWFIRWKLKLSTEADA